MDLNSVSEFLSKIDWKLIQSILQVIISIFAVVAGIAVAFSAIARCVEAWYQLSQKPGLNSWGSIVQWWKNFWSIEKYDGKELK